MIIKRRVKGAGNEWEDQTQDYVSNKKNSDNNINNKLVNVSPVHSKIENVLRQKPSSKTRHERGSEEDQKR